jgi:hypothetical protein
MIIRDIDGNIVPMGRMSKRIEEGFFGTSLPSWLAVTGTSTAAPTNQLVDMTAATGGIRLNCAANINSTIYLGMFPNGLKFDMFKEIIIDVNFNVWNVNSNFRFELLNAGKTKGVKIEDDSSQLKVYPCHSVNGFGAATLAHYKVISGGENNKRHSLRFRLQSDGTVVIGTQDTIFFEKKFSPSELQMDDILFPKIGIINRVSGSYTMNISKIAAEVVYNQ